MTPLPSSRLSSDARFQEYFAGLWRSPYWNGRHAINGFGLLQRGWVLFSKWLAEELSPISFRLQASVLSTEMTAKEELRIALEKCRREFALEEQAMALQVSYYSANRSGARRIIGWPMGTFRLSGWMVSRVYHDKCAGGPEYCGNLFDTLYALICSVFLVPRGKYKASFSNIKQEGNFTSNLGQDWSSFQKYNSFALHMDTKHTPPLSSSPLPSPPHCTLTENTGCCLAYAGKYIFKSPPFLPCHWLWLHLRNNESGLYCAIFCALLES